MRFFLSLIAGLTVGVSHANTIDQNAATTTGVMAGWEQLPLTQSFQQSAANVSGAGIFLQPSNGSYWGNVGQVTIKLFDKLPNNGGTALAQGIGLAPHGGGWFDLYWGPVAVVPNFTYFLTFDLSYMQGIAGDAGNGYSRGQLYLGPGFVSIPEYDFTFRTYSGVSAVPEPQISALLLCGLVVGCAAARVRKVRARLSHTPLA